MSFEVDTHELRRSISALESCQGELVGTLSRGLMRAEEDLPEAMGGAEDGALSHLLEAIRQTKERSAHLATMFDCYLDVLVEVCGHYRRAEDEVERSARALLGSDAVTVTSGDSQHLGLSPSVGGEADVVGRIAFFDVGDRSGSVAQLFASVVEPL